MAAVCRVHRARDCGRDHRRDPDLRHGPDFDRGLPNDHDPHRGLDLDRDRRAGHARRCDHGDDQSPRDDDAHSRDGRRDDCDLDVRRYLTSCYGQVRPEWLRLPWWRRVLARRRTLSSASR